MTDQPMSETARRWREQNMSRDEPQALPDYDDLLLAVLERIAAALEKIAERRT